jgi:hypothetical protein
MKTMRIGILVLAFSSLLISCRNQDGEEVNIVGIPIKTRGDEKGSIDFQLVIDETENEVKKIFPEGSYQGAVLFTTCANLPYGDGRLAIAYVGKRKEVLGFGKNIYQVIAEIDTTRSKLDLSSIDVTDYYPTIASYSKPTNKDFQDVLTIVHNYLNEKRIESCEVTISQLENQWDILCDPKNATEAKCDFSIDATTYEINENQLQP